MENIHIRPANVNDAESIAMIHVETWQFTYRGQLPDDYLNSLSVKNRAAQWREGLAKPHLDNWTLVAETNGQITGFCTVGKSRDDDADDKTGELWTIYIDKEHMGRKIGSFLMREGLKILKDHGFKKATLWVLESNKRGRKFYETRGWISDGKTRIVKQGNVEFREIHYSINL